MELNTFCIVFLYKLFKVYITAECVTSFDRTTNLLKVNDLCKLLFFSGCRFLLFMLP